MATLLVERCKRCVRRCSMACLHRQQQWLWPRMGDVVVVSRVLCHGMPRSSAHVATCSRGWLVIWDCGWFITCVVHTA